MDWSTAGVTLISCWMMYRCALLTRAAANSNQDGCREPTQSSRQTAASSQVSQFVVVVPSVVVGQRASSSDRSSISATHHPDHTESTTIAIRDAASFTRRLTLYKTTHTAQLTVLWWLPVQVPAPFSLAHVNSRDADLQKLATVTNAIIGHISSTAAANEFRQRSSETFSCDSECLWWRHSVHRARVTSSDSNADVTRLYRFEVLQCTVGAVSKKSKCVASRGHCTFTEQQNAASK